MRSYLLLLFCLISLPSCVNYEGIKPTGHPYRASALSTPYHYTVPKKNVASTCQPCWWHKFHDPQLNQLIAIALTESPTIDLAISRVRQASHFADQARASLWPTLNFHSNVAKERFTANSIIPPPYGGEVVDLGNVALNFSYELDWWGKNRETLAARISEVRAVQADFIATQLMVSASVASTYFQLQGDLAQLKIKKDMLQQRRDILKIVETRTRHHIESDIPLSTAIEETQAAERSLTRAQQAMLITQHQLALLLGKNPLATRIQAQPFIYKKYLFSLPPTIPAHLLARRPDICASRWKVEATKHQITAAKARFFPDINLRGFLSYQAIGLTRLFFQDSRDNTIQAAIDLPLFDAGERRAHLRIRDDEYDLAVGQYNQTILNALHEVADQITQLQHITSEEKIQSDVVKATERRYSLMKSRFNHGITDYNAVLNIQGTLLKQKQIQIQLQTQHMITLVAMIKALGGDYAAEGLT